jgi:diaminopimelate decarboxylase/aspartate kinase
LHELLIRPVRDDAVIGPTWERLFGARPSTSGPMHEPWWQRRRTELLELMRSRDCAYVYDVATVEQRCANLRNMTSLSRVSYAMKANSSPELLRAIHASGLKIECVSVGEIARAFEAIPGLRPDEVLFTPNFAPREEYVSALAQGVHVTLDNLHPLERWPELFKGRNVFVRIDPGSGRGHHQHVRTGGVHSKFGVAQEDWRRFAAAAKEAGATVVGLHAHAGSGVHDIDNWLRTARLLLSLREIFPQARVIDIGGGIGVPDRHGAPHFDLEGLDAALLTLNAEKDGIELWMEPGRYVVAEAGVLLAKVTQTKTKGAAGYVGVATGMNSLIRPALYGAHHDIVNLTRLGESTDGMFDVVGPICETGDVLGHDRALPAATAEGDVMLIATTGAYGAAMSSNYNLRAPASELLLR